MGGKGFVDLGKEVGRLVTAKNRKYGNSIPKTAEIMALLYPGGVKVWQFEDFLLQSRITEKQARIAEGAADEDEDPWMDVTGYGMLALKLARELKGKADGDDEAMAKAELDERLAQPALLTEAERRVFDKHAEDGDGVLDRTDDGREFKCAGCEDMIRLDEGEKCDACGLFFCAKCMSQGAPSDLCKGCVSLQETRMEELKAKGGGDEE